MKTTKSGKEENGVAYKGITKLERKQSIDYIKMNSGNTNMFTDNISIYDNFVEIVNDADLRLQMLNVVSYDNGNGGLSDNNNREYGGVVRSGVVIPSEQGPVGDPRTVNSLEINIPSIEGDIVFHSHPSGNYYPSLYSSTVIKTESRSASWRQYPSVQDLTKSSTNKNNNYIFARGDRMIYIYNENGILTMFPQSCFLKFKRK